MIFVCIMWSSDQHTADIEFRKILEIERKLLTLTLL